MKSVNSNNKLVPGGSSGGSAAAVSGDLCVASLGTDTEAQLDNQHLLQALLD